MWTILFILTLGNDHSNTSSAVTSQLIGSYSNIQTCQYVANQLRYDYNQFYRSYTSPRVIVRCVQVKEK